MTRVANIKFTGVEEWVKKLNDIGIYAETFVMEAVYEGAKVMADEVKSALKNLPVDNHPAQLGYTRKSISSLQRKGLIDSFGIAVARNDDDFINVKVGFDGYNEVYSINHPNGQPNQMIARSLVSGTSFMPKNDFIGKAYREKKASAEKAIANSLIQSINKLTK